MERRDFLKFALGVAASAAALSASAQAVPLAPHSLNDDALRAASQDRMPIPPSPPKTKSIISSRNKCVGVTVMAGAWHHHHWGWRHRHWGWHRRHWGWHRRWHRHHWRRRYW